MISSQMTTSTSSSTSPPPPGPVRPTTSWMKACGRLAMMPIMINREMPLPRPRSVMRSPSHMTNSVLELRMTTLVNIQKVPSGRALASIVA